MPIEEERSCVSARREQKRAINKMARMFKIGVHVGWNSEAGRVTGTVIAVHTTVKFQQRYQKRNRN